MAHTSHPTSEDGYYEILLSLSEKMEPLMKCRAVRSGSGLYKAVVRDFKKGILIEESGAVFISVEEALTHSINLALDFLAECSKR